MEYMENGAIMKDSRKLEPIPEQLARKYMRDVISGLEYRMDLVE